MTPSQFEARWRHDVDHAEKTLFKDGHVSPLFCVVGKDGQNHLMPASFGSAEEKARAYDMARLTAIAHDAELVMCRAEAWLVLGPMDQGITPSQSDRRLEVVSVVISARVGRRVVHRSCLREILRGEDGRPTGLRDVALPKGKLDMTGPMFELLPPKRPDAGQRAMAEAYVQVMRERNGV